MSQKKIWSASAKLEIAILAIKGEMTIADICKHYQVGPTMSATLRAHILIFS